MSHIHTRICIWVREMSQIYTRKCMCASHVPDADAHERAKEGVREGGGLCVCACLHVCMRGCVCIYITEQRSALERVRVREYVRMYNRREKNPKSFAILCKTKDCMYNRVKKRQNKSNDCARLIAIFFANGLNG